jgi:3-oxoacyl-[acyl-carrier-protein] synthase II
MQQTLPGSKRAMAGAPVRATAARRAGRGVRGEPLRARTCQQLAPRYAARAFGPASILVGAIAALLRAPRRATTDSTTAAARPPAAAAAPRAAAAAGPRTDPSQRVVITGMGVVSCFGNDVDAFYNELLAGTSGVGAIDRFDASEFPTNFAAQIRNFDNEGLIDKKNARRYDDCLSYTLVAAKKAMRQAGIEKEGCPEGHAALDKARAGVLIGSGMGGLMVFQEGVRALVEKGYKKITPFFIPYAITNMGGALVAIEQGLMGPNYSISTACATANYAFVQAANHIRNGDADLMLAGGSEAPVIPVGLGGFVACRALSTRCDEPARASRPWDAGRDGFVMGEGAGVLVMESLAHAQARGATILAEYLGGALTCDAHHMTDPHPDGLGVSTCIELALKVRVFGVSVFIVNLYAFIAAVAKSRCCACVNPRPHASLPPPPPTLHSPSQDARVDRDAVNYINAHATSTLVGDKAEIKAIKKAFTGGLKGVKINGTKSMIGHGLGAAGGLEAVATIQAIRTGWVHPTINHEEPIEEVAGLDVCAGGKSQQKITVGISNSFGFGGHNSVVAFAPFKE